MMMITTTISLTADVDGSLAWLRMLDYTMTVTMVYISVGLVAK